MDREAVPTVRNGSSSQCSREIFRRHNTLLALLFSPGLSYPGSGICLGPALTFGYLAARAAILRDKLGS